jgi:serine protease Do
MSTNIFKNRPWLLTASLALALATTGFLGVRAATPGNQAATVKMAPASESVNHGYSAVVKRVAPAVVNISSTKVVKQQAMQMDPMLRQFFGDQFGGSRGPQSHKEHGLGSGVIVSPEGYILTNNHVIDGATEVNVTLHDKREFKARVVGTDPRTDIAVLKIEGSGFPSLMLADSTKVEVGDIVLAVGNPFGVGQTVTMGIVGAIGRGGLGIEQVEDFIQVDAPINPGNSGGALVNEQGYLIGINTAIIGSSGGSQGIGFAVPINMARHDMDQIVAHGKVERAYLGILPQDVTPTLAAAFHAQTTGALVGDVTPESPAAKANLRKGDIILDINGQPVADANQLRLKIGMLPVGSDAKLNVLRDGHPMTLNVKLTSFPEKEEKASLDEKSMPGDSNAPVLGVSIENLTPETARQLKLPAQTAGVVIAEVNPEGRAAEAGLRPGDVIQEVNHQAVKDVQEFKQALSKSKKDDTVLLLVHREGNTIYLTA